MTKQGLNKYWGEIRYLGTIPESAVQGEAAALIFGTRPGQDSEWNAFQLLQPRPDFSSTL